jgi:beta-lactamase regulating signal transducer with metallopeptidase domain
MNAAVWFDSLGVDPQLCGRLCLTLAHSLWQLGLLAILATVIGRVRNRDNPERGYAIYVAALLLGIAALPITFAVVQVPALQVAVAQKTSATQSVTIPRSFPQQTEPSAELNLPVAAQRGASAADVESSMVPEQSPTAIWLLNLAPWLAGCYATGVIVMILRLGQGIWKSQQLAAQATPITAGPLCQALHALAESWSLCAIPALAEAPGIVVPQVVGFLRPTILLPASALMGLTPQELEMILAHELAHVRRYDMWVSLVQRLAETVLFFQPGSVVSQPADQHLSRVLLR